jgi:hypothetical protein
LFQVNWSPICETGNGLLELLYHVLCFYSAVEDRAISALTKDLLVQGTLTTLALNPEITVVLLVKLELLLTFDVDLLHALAAVVTDDVLFRLKQIFATETCFLDDCEFEDACGSGSLGGYDDMPGVFAS